MSVLNVSADFRGFDDLLDRASRPLDLRYAKSALAAFYARREEEQFARAPWRQLSKRYAREKAKDFPGQSILRRTGALYEGLTGPETVDVTQDVAVVGVRAGVGRSALFYAQFAQEGRGEPKRTLMPRLKREERDELVDIIRVSVLERVLHARR